MPTEPKGKSRPWITKVKPFSQFNRDFNYQDPRWRKLSVLKRRANPLCEDCQEKGITKASQMVDHIKPISKGGGAWAWDNLRALCNHCHAIKTGKG